MEFGSLHAREFLQECTHKKRITVNEDGFRNSMKATYLLHKNFDNVSRLYGCFSNIKGLYLESLSTTTKIVS